MHGTTIKIMFGIFERAAMFFKGEAGSYKPEK
jgi:hypothetical protein